jgi:hypothetical protein
MLDLVPLCSAVVEVAPSLSIGTGPFGPRSIGAITLATITGERLQATLAGPAAADWMVRSGSFGVIDARLAVITADGALIFVQYGGRLDLSNPAAGFTAVVAPVFECGDERYSWLNSIQAIGKGKLSVGPTGTARLEYEFYEVR